jgi:PAS domain S-box-containing protein
MAQESSEELRARLDEALGRLTELEGSLLPPPSGEAPAAHGGSRLSSILQAIQAGVIIQDASGRIRFANQAACAAFGIPLDQMIGKYSQAQDWEMFLDDGTPVPPEEHPSMITLRTARPMRDTVRQLRLTNSGRTLWLLINTEPVISPATGEVIEAIITFLDITALKQTSEALRETRGRYEWSRRLLDAMAENMADMLWAKDTSGRFLFANRAMREKLLLSGGIEVVDNTDLFFAQRQRSLGNKHTFGELCVDSDEVVLSSARPGRFLEDGFAGGSYLALDVLKSPLYDENGGLMGTVGTARDITMQKMLEEEYASLVDKAPMGIFRVTLDGRYLQANSYMAAMFGYRSPEELMDLSRDSAFDSNADPERRDALLSEILEKGQVENREMRRLRRDGVPVWISASLRAVRDPAGRPMFLDGFAVDVTARKRNEERLQASLAEKEVLLKEIHHRVKNNLQILMSLMNLQAESMGRPEDMEAFKAMQCRVRSISLVHERLYGSGNLSAVGMRGYVGELVKQLSGACLDVARTVALDLQVEDITLSVDKAIPFGLLLTELITNAFKHAFEPGQTGTLRIALRRSGSMCVAEVEDNGPGIPPDFDPLTSRTLGFQLIRALEGQLGGTLRYSTRGGTRFEVCFPA